MKKHFLFFSLWLSAIAIFAQTDTAKIDSFRFVIQKQLKITPVKNQASSGTCWSFSGIGFFESELLRMGKPEIDLSEMFVVHHSYSDKADKYVRMYGTGNFGGGGSFYDVAYVIKNYGIVPESAMPGLNYGEEAHKHGELDALTEAYVKVIATKPNKKISTAWKAGYDGILDAYLGQCPKEFTMDGKKQTPLTYAQWLGLDMDNYVSLTSFSHHPFYNKFIMEVPDNWRNDEMYNLPINEFIQVLDNALDKGYPVAWASDVSEKGFSSKGVAVNPETKKANLPGTDQAKWLNISQKDMEDKIMKMDRPRPEIQVTQELRQEAFDSQQTTDDHGMLIYGTAKDQLGTKYYLVKNSWGAEGKNKGIWYASESFVKYKTIDIMIHKDAIPKDIQKKLGMK